MKRRKTLARSALVIGALVLACLGAGAGDIERVQEIQFRDFDSPEAKELFDLSRRAPVRTWLRQQFREQVKQGEQSPGSPEHWFTLLVRSGAGREELQLLIDEAPHLDKLGFSRLAQILLERAPLSLDMEPLLVVPLQAEKEPAPSFWVGKGKPGQNLSEEGILKGKFHQREFNLALAPTGEVYLIASQREPANREARDHAIVKNK